MSDQLTPEDVRFVLKNVMHPAIDHSLLDLGIVKDFTVTGKVVNVVMAMPFPEVPIKDMLIDLVRQPLIGIGAQPEFELTVMNDEERQHFLEMEQSGWRGM